MEADARYVWVGAAVLALVAALVAGLVWLSPAGRGADQRTFLILFEHQALDGLDVGGDVLLRGIKVGRVADVALSDEKVNRVRVTIRVDRRAPVHRNTVAVITRNFVTGIAAITLVTREPVGPLLVDVPEGESHPVIAEGRSDLEEITGRVTKVGEMAATTLSHLNKVLDEPNREALQDTLRNLRTLTAGLNERLSTLDTTLTRVTGAADRVGNAADRVGAAGDRITGVVVDAGDNVSQSLRQIDLTLAEARRALQGVTQTTVVLQSLAASAVGRFDQTLEHTGDQLSAALVELRMSVESASRVIDGLRDPRAALLGPKAAELGPGESLKK